MTEIHFCAVRKFIFDLSSSTFICNLPDLIHVHLLLVIPVGGKLSVMLIILQNGISDLSDLSSNP